MHLTNPLTEVLRVLWFLGFGTLLGFGALRLTGYTVTSWLLACSVGVFGLVVGKHFFPGGIINWNWLATSWGHPLIPGFLFAFVPPLLLNGIRWWMAVGSERWKRAGDLAAKEQTARKSNTSDTLAP